MKNKPDLITNTQPKLFIPDDEESISLKECEDVEVVLTIPMAWTNQDVINNFRISKRGKIYYHNTPGRTFYRR